MTTDKNRKITLRKRRRWLWILILLIIIAGLISWKLFSPQLPYKVKVFTVASGRVEETVSATSAGTVRPLRDSLLSSELASKIVNVFFDEGDLVMAGAELIKLDVSELQAQLSIIKAEITTADSQIVQATDRFELTESELAKGKKLLEDKIVSDQEFERLKTNNDLAQEDINIARANLARLNATGDELELRITKTIIKAPFTGVITKKYIELGESVAPGTPLMDIVDDSILKIEAPVDEIDVHKVQTGKPARLTIDAYKGQTFSGQVSFVSPIVEATREQNRTAKIKVDITKDHVFKIGMSVYVEVITNTVESAVYIPSNILRENFEDNSKFVFAAENDRIKKVPVKIGVHNWERTQILEGLKPGDKVISEILGDSQKELKDGDRIRLAE
ncbi:MAG: efflux RND transporter periplasmic adaptor subunit [Planctomycetes bacterium]|nr:efflux RND transporter periplasmic adaptor subunit [Planctomycetota bacterium]